MENAPSSILFGVAAAPSPSAAATAAVVVMRSRRVSIGASYYSIRRTPITAPECSTGTPPESADSPRPDAMTGRDASATPPPPACESPPHSTPPRVRGLLHALGQYDR